MNDDTISRQAAINTALRAISDLQGKDSIRDDYIISEMEEIPSAEQHGRWIIYPVSPWDGEDVKCSVCGEKGCAPYWDYCPHCGSRMDLDGDTE